MTDGTTGSRTFTVPGGLEGMVEVLNEARTLPIDGGKFTDAFPAATTFHIYRVKL